MLHECNSNVFTYLHDEKSCIEIIHSIKDKIYIFTNQYFQLLLADYFLIHSYCRQAICFDLFFCEYFLGRIITNNAETTK